MEPLAIYGSVAATIALIINLFSFLRNSTKVKLKVKTNQILIPAEPQYKKNTPYIAVTIINNGRRPFTINTVGFEYFKKKGGAILTDSGKYGPREINEGQSSDYLVEQKLVNLKDVIYFFAKDNVGKTHIKRIAPFYKFFIYKTIIKPQKNLI